MMDIAARREYVFLALDCDLNSRGPEPFIEATARSLAWGLFHNDPEMPASIKSADEIVPDVQAWLDLHPSLENDPDYYSLTYAVAKLQGTGFTARLVAVKLGDESRLILIAYLTRPNFNDGQPVEIFNVGVFDGTVLRDSFTDHLARYHENKKKGYHLFETNPCSVLMRELVKA
jgi:hypothetical protein